MKYIELLEKNWKQHLAEKSKDAPTVISLFAGCGGSSLGYSMAGYRELLAVEWDSNAIETFKKNFVNVPVFEGDIKYLSIEQVFELGKINFGELDVLDGSPPCQGFSTVGKRELMDDRNNLFLEYARLLKGIKPKFFVMENVSGMIKGHMKFKFVEILKALKSTGYRVRVQILNASNFFVPQARQRVIFIGIREDLEGEITFPKKENKIFNFREAVFNCPKGEIEDERLVPEKLKEVIKYINDNSIVTKKLLLKFLGKTGGYIGLKKILWDKPCRTLIKSEIEITGLVHPDGKRYISVPEAMRCCSFPDSFLFVGCRKEKMARLGNCAPPFLMYAIAKNIRENMKLERSNK